MSQPLTAFASRLADAARLITLASANRAIAVKNKGRAGVFDPVTAADKAAEQVIRDLIEQNYPTHGIEGEELGRSPGQSVYSWSVDPIDGTRSYTCGLPTWTTLIALLEAGQPVFGIIDAPRLDERYSGNGRASRLERGGIASPLRASSCVQLNEARLATTDPFLFTGSLEIAFTQLRKTVRTTRFGLDAYGYARLAAGSLDLVVECSLKPHDLQALIPVVRGAGGVFGDWVGGEDFASGNVIAASTFELYAATVAIMRQALA